MTTFFDVCLKTLRD